MKLLETLKTRSVIIGMFMVAVILFAANDSLLSQQTTIPLTPKLSLTGADETFLETFYPDGRIWVPTSEGEPREFLVPVFIDNRWYTYYYQSQDYPRYIAKPIQSFSFSVFYNSKAVRAIGVETVTPNFLRKTMGDENPLTKDWNISVNDQADNWYLHYINPNIWQARINDSDGRRITIAGSSSLPLGNTDFSFNGVRDGQERYKVLLFVRFRVELKRIPGQPVDQAQRSIMYIDNREIVYNNTNIYEKSMINELSDYDTDLNWQVAFPEPPPNTPQFKFARDYNRTGLGGVSYVRYDNDEIITLTRYLSLEPLEPYRYGSIALNIGDYMPDFDLNVEGSDGSSETEQNLFRENEGQEWRFTQPFTVDTRSNTPGYASSRVVVTATPSGSRLSYIQVESDARWLQFRTIPLQWTNQINEWSRLGFIDYIDNETIGGAAGLNILNNVIVARVARPREILEIRATPLIAQDTYIENGVYTGYVTLKSPYARINPTRIKVTFIHLRNPIEETGDGNLPGGIHLVVRNSSGAAGTANTLVFGTGDRATYGIDRLYGEFAYTSLPPANQFWARFFPPDPSRLEGDPIENANLVAYGYGDYAPDRINPRTVSRDIRSNQNVGESHTYLVRFNAAGAVNYPVIVRWSTNHFPPGSQLFLRPNKAGAASINMRTDGTPAGTNLYEYTITDQTVTSFIIEYTPSDVIEYVDDQGNPIIKRGWNLLSLPVRPGDATYTNVYPNAINIPIKFANNQAQAENVLRPGIGYFIKYSNTVDTRFSGSKIYEISNDVAPFDPVFVYGGDGSSTPAVPRAGWNTVGAVSHPGSVEHISFTQYANQPIPDQSVTLDYQVWGYRTGVGYYPTTVLQPGLGYWIKVNSDGYYKFNPPLPVNKIAAHDYTHWKDDILKSSRRIVINDNAQSSTTLYATNNSNVNAGQFELPPAPPHGLFDVRFQDDKYLTTSNEEIIHLQGVTYPIALNIENADADYYITDAATGFEYGVISKGSSASVVVNNTTFGMLKLTRKNLSAEIFEADVYPNPADEFSTLNVAIPEDGFVSVKLYDALGQVVANIFEGAKSKGIFTERIDVGNLSSGNYFVKISFGNETYSLRLNVVK